MTVDRGEMRHFRRDLAIGHCFGRFQLDDADPKSSGLDAIAELAFGFAGTTAW
ncbi:MAG TPA: hypothetical protein VHX65_00840 [Pirellulales bacterium]|jgi:hypothetical protein|nr:hypothetical protein [Pirellulales bacterium]